MGLLRPHEYKLASGSVCLVFRGSMGFSPFPPLWSLAPVTLHRRHLGCWCEGKVLERSQSRAGLFGGISSVDDEQHRQEPMLPVREPRRCCSDLASGDVIPPLVPWDSVAWLRRLGPCGP